MAKTYQSRPSNFLRISSAVDAYHLDRAVMHFGTALERALEQAVAYNPKRKQQMSEAQRNHKTQEILARWLGPDVIQKKYKDPMSRFK